MSIRSLESVIRISTAYAKLRLSSEIGLRDAVMAFSLYLFAFYGGYYNIDPNFFKGIDKSILSSARLATNPIKKK